MDGIKERVLVATVTLCLLGAAFPATGAAGSQLNCDAHQPIRILEDKGDDGFVWDDPVTGEEVYRPGSGVVASDATALSPYVIEGWCISGADWDPPNIELKSCGFDFGDATPDPESIGVVICGTSESFELRNTTVNLSSFKAVDSNDTTWRYNEATGYTHAGMHVDGAENVTVRTTNFADTNGTALMVENTDTTVDARQNWWGCPDGPDDAACDDVVGDAVYEPWLAAPVSDAEPG